MKRPDDRCGSKCVQENMRDYSHIGFIHYASLDKAEGSAAKEVCSDSLIVHHTCSDVPSKHR